MRHPLLVLFASLCLASPAFAERLVVPIGQQQAGDLKMPRHGQSKTAVVDQFGRPSREHAAVGKPPITRWDYPGFSVYFEYDHVIDSVVSRPPKVAPDRVKP